MFLRTIRGLAVLIAFSLFAISARAADKPVAPADLIGTWTITGPDVGGRVTLEFAAPDQLTVVRTVQGKYGDERSQGLGPAWKLAENKLTFTGSMSTNDFEIKGRWTLAWDGPDKLAATAGKGKKYQLVRVAAARGVAGAPADKAAAKPAAPTAADLFGIWTVTGQGLGRGILTMEFDAPDRLVVVRFTNGDAGTLSTGPQWKLTGNKLVFSGSLTEGKFEIDGTWTLAFDSPDKIVLVVTTANGKTFHLTREVASKPAAKPADNAGAKPATAGDLIGIWTINGPGLDAFKATLEFIKPDTLSLVRIAKSKDGDDRSQSTGPTWKRIDNTITFHGSLATDDFKIKGDWALAWDGPDKFAATTGRGKIYHLERVKAK